MSIRRWLPAAVFVVMALVAGWIVVRAAAPSAAAVTLAPSDVAFASGQTVPVDGWVRPPAPGVNLAGRARGMGIDPPTLWVRYRFRAPADGGALSVATEFMRERYVIFLNGVDIYRTGSGRSDANLTWHHPVAVPLPWQILRPGDNILVFRVESPPTRPLAIGSVSVGGDATVQIVAARRTLFETTGPQVINGVLAILSLGTLLFWLVRPRETVFGWLAVVGAVWWFRNLHYYIDRPIFDEDLFWALTTDSIFAVLALTYGFAATFLDLPDRRRVVAAIFGLCGVGIVLRHVLVAIGRADTLAFLVTLPVALATLALLATACRRAPRVENLLMLGAVALATAFGFHDLLMSTNSRFAIGIYLQPYGSLLVFSAFGFALGRRMLLALAINENVNALLEASVAEATGNLARSEARRRALQIASAIETERERLMREIHDGIGSSLITALAVAERSRESPRTIATLKRAITDLRIGVDSLEPIDGDVVMLLASLRHRTERELVAAGLAFVWKVEAVPILPWLDAVAALHVLRILQEAVSNILAHAGATLVEVGCRCVMKGDADGVLITITDNGCGVGHGPASGGRGIVNMQNRAEALHALLACQPADPGTRVSLWLPCRVETAALATPRLAS